MPSELYNQITSQKGKLENLIGKIPGFKGYQEKQAHKNKRPPPSGRDQDNLI